MNSSSQYYFVIVALMWNKDFFFAVNGSDHFDGYFACISVQDQQQQNKRRKKLLHYFG